MRCNFLGNTTGTWGHDESGSFLPYSHSPRFPFAPGRFALIYKMKYGKYHCKYSYFGCCKACSWVLYLIHSTYANILKNIYKKVRKNVGIG